MVQDAVGDRVPAAGHDVEGVAAGVVGGVAAGADAEQVVAGEDALQGVADGLHGGRDAAVVAARPRNWSRARSAPPRRPAPRAARQRRGRPRCGRARRWRPRRPGDGPVARLDQVRRRGRTPGPARPGPPRRPGSPRGAPCAVSGAAVGEACRVRGQGQLRVLGGQLQRRRGDDGEGGRGDARGGEAVAATAGRSRGPAPATGRNRRPGRSRRGRAGWSAGRPSPDPDRLTGLTGAPGAVGAEPRLPREVAGEVTGEVTPEVAPEVAGELGSREMPGARAVDADRATAPGGAMP